MFEFQKMPKLSSVQTAALLSGSCYSKSNLDKLRRIVLMINTFESSLVWDKILQLNDLMEDAPHMTVQKLDHPIVRKCGKIEFYTYISMAENSAYKAKFTNFAEAIKQVKF